MFDIYEMQPETQEPSAEGKDVKLKPYQKPFLEDLGDLRTLTLGGSPGIGDSGFGSPELVPF